jgi:transposase
VEGARGIPGIQELLHTWADRSTTILREARGLEQRYLNHRDWFYHNLVSDLCRRYQQISIVTLDQEAMAAGMTLNASSYHHLLAPARFVTFLRQAAVKTGTEVKMQSQLRTSSKVSGDAKSVVRPSSAGKKLKHIVKSVA